MSDGSTIYALSSGRLPAAIAVIRISGPRAGDALKALCGRIPEARKAALARVRDPATGEMIDEALALWFPGPNSETGEDVVELQLHGGRAVVAATFAALGRFEGLRPAEAGEFTRRGFENGKLDLTAVEGLADLVMAETEAQRRQAFRQMKGALGMRAEAWRRKLIQALALVEARIDFSDEGDVPEDLVSPALVMVRELAGEIEAALADGGRGERLREGMVVAIAGPPNAGKSTLLNRIAQREAAIVSPYAGTTRDVIEVHLDLEGWPVTLLDTAGIRETGDPVEMEGVRRARERAAKADLVLWVEDARVVGGSDLNLDSSLETLLLRPEAIAGGVSATSGGIVSTIKAPENAVSDPGGPPIWRLRNKIDLLATPAPQSISPDPKNELDSYLAGRNDNGRISSNPTLAMVNRPLTPLNESVFTKSEHIFSISATSGVGFDRLMADLISAAESLLSQGESALITRERHRRSLADTLSALKRANDEPLSEEILAEELRAAGHELGRLTGRVDIEEILDVIFRDFCIGK